ncbi:PEPxxWA-CTERM sorting domain-containing protein [Sphingomonas sp. TREG-RG-20F-R18-01]|uniref:PEPxxWA-CTERM sorting domain-containing protein n=1 Tax=Sphingomonas sp. TREG-RG-20F-R18-01 TaxID=2914982 RepID=UPI001F57A1D8|nr:PEPxxWA-CTERM sorting domain-containing protein [Sphingomonas sp. TREG-RG-20F-R18-01]
MKKLALGMATAMVAFASPAYAAPLLFDFSGPSGTALFQLDSNPTPDTFSSFLGSDQLAFKNVAGIFGGIAGVASNIGFGNGLFASLNINAPNVGFSQFSSPTLFSGPANAPVFSTGTFTLVNPFFGNANLKISAVAGAVPEPATWTMMLLGFGGIGFAMRRRSRVRTTVSYA